MDWQTPALIVLFPAWLLTLSYYIWEQVQIKKGRIK